MAREPITPSTTRRSGLRKGLRRPATLSLAGNASQPATLCDVGLDGLSLHVAKPIAPGTRCSVSFEIPVGPQSATLRADIKTVYSSFSGAQGFRIGAVFVDLDAQSTALLREFSAPEA